MSWYTIENIQSIDSPALIFYKDYIVENIQHSIRIVKDAHRLRPHIKTNKTKEICALMMEHGITKFKCATIAEAEMLGIINAPDVLLASQPVGPKAYRLLDLVNAYPNTSFSCLTDDLSTANKLSDIFAAQNKIIDVYIDLNTGMNRTGIRPPHALQLFRIFQSFKGIHVKGLHAYDGHIHNKDAALAKKLCDEAFEPVTELATSIQEISTEKLTIVAGGSPTFSFHAQRPHVECSPGTFIFWDWGYKKLLPHLPFHFAALVITRIISIPDADTICTDMGHKSIASEHPHPRVQFLNLPGAQPIAQTEEHLSLRVPDSSLFTIGDVLYGIPTHICPTVALYDSALVAEKNKVSDKWKITARGRCINI